ncbi:MAG: bifunctional homocysteine S-methyltransferase/methylenetetrahydrofolate reductase [Clostridiales bacterium]|nr:bifunctional homocysteine S-methyltransferase/methylenetetrahydrofolate reductase [Clostridiales bacterium]
MKNLLFFDGACGTYYHELYGSEIKCEMANISAPERIERIHQDYISAGARAIRTNSFGVSAATINNPELRRRLIKRSYSIAKDAAKKTEGVSVFADIGYVYAPGRDTAGDYLESAEIFIGCGAKNFLFETLDEIDCILPAVQLIRQRVEDPVIMVSFAVSADGYTAKGLHYRALIDSAYAAGAYIAGMNCVCGPSDMLALVKNLPIGDRKLSVLPNSNYPAQTGFGLRFSNNASYFAEKMLEIYRYGVFAIGGCCGTTPAHIRKTVEIIEKEGMVRDPLPSSVSEPQDMPVRTSRLYNSVKNGDPIIAVEIDPPDNTDIDFLMQSAKRLKSCGADVITLADSPLARSRADSFIIAAKVQREIGIDTLPHLACRDKNRIAIHGQLLGANIERVQNVLVVTGDSVAKNEDVTAVQDKNVFNFNAITLISYIHHLNGTLFDRAPYLIAAALNLNAVNFEAELRRAQRKEEAGALLFLTQALFTEESLENLRIAREGLKGRILAGILPLAGYRNAVFLNNEVSGMTIPETLIQNLNGKSPEETKRISLDFSRGMIDRARPFCDGYYLMTARRKIDFVCELVSYIKLKCRTEKNNI